MADPLPPPKKNAIQIRWTGNRWSVRCRHGWELADDIDFALVLWDAAWKRGK